MSLIKKPIVSIIVPCFNQAEFLDEALTSVLQQTFKDWECIIIDDGSTDDTSLIVGRWTKSDLRYKLKFHENRGLSATRNEGIRLAQGKYILPLDADDRIGPNYLKLAIEIMSDSKVKLVYCKAKKFGLINSEWDLPVYKYEDLLKGNLIFCSAIFRKTDFSNTNGYDEKMKKGYEDWDFWLQLLNTDDKVIRINSFEFYYRIKEKSMLMSINDELSKDLRNYIFMKHIKNYLFYWDPILDKRNLTTFFNMYSNSIDYRFGNLIINPFRKLYNYFKYICK